ncbi:pilus assembly protein PilM, partial [Candidatus Peregrinibacteria bacterium]|nr:pilus assembly protein PilM [Candidatus Peregrinibacteria bacterium]
MDASLKHTFGLEITNSSLRAVELGVSPLGIRVVNFSTVDLEPDTVEDDCIIINPEAFKKALETLLLGGENGPFFSKNAVICVPEEKTFSHLLSVPREKANDRAFILNLAKDFIPIDLTEAIVDYKPLKSAPGDKEIRFNFVAIQKNIVRSLIQLIAESGLQVIAVEVSKNSLLRVCNNRFQKNEGDFMALNIEPEISLFSLATENGATYTLDSKIAGNTCMEKVKKQLNIATLHEAKAIFSELAKDPEAPKTELYGQIKEFLKDNLRELTEKAKNLI